MTQTRNVISAVAPRTIVVDCCNWAQVGQVTFSTNSRYESLQYVTILFIFNFLLHGLADSNHDQRFWRPLFYH